MSKYLKPRVKMEDLILVESQESEIKCGKCGRKMTFRVYYKKKEQYDFIACENCQIFLQRIMLDEK